jgi:hypothetical protein
MPVPISNPLRHSLARARERDARIGWLLDSHPVTAAMLVRLGLFPNRNKALRRLNRLVARKRIHLVGTVSRGIGRPEHVFCRWGPKVNQLLHEIELTELCFRLDAGTIRRGAQVTDRRRPDAEVCIGGRLYLWEHDRGTEGLAQIARRFQQYEDSPHLVLWVCPTQARMESLRKGAEKLRHVALFTTFAQALASPHGEIWRDYQGQKAALPRESYQKQPLNRLVIVEPRHPL